MHGGSRSAAQLIPVTSGVGCDNAAPDPPSCDQGIHERGRNGAVGTGQRIVTLTPLRRLRYNAEPIGDWGAAWGPPDYIVGVTAAERLRAAGPHQIAHVESDSGEAEIGAAGQRRR